MRRELEHVEAMTPTVGHAEARGEPEPLTLGETAGVLWVPDPEARRGWREYHVLRPKPGARPMGFRR